MQAFASLGNYSAALRLVHNMAEVYDRGPGGQSHQVFEVPGQTPFELPQKTPENFAMSGSTIANRIISGLFGVVGSLQEDEVLPDPVGYLHDPDIPRGFNGELQHVNIRGGLYTVTSIANVGLSIVKE